MTLLSIYDINVNYKIEKSKLFFEKMAKSGNSLQISKRFTDKNRYFRSGRTRNFNNCTSSQRNTRGSMADCNMKTTLS